MFDDPPMDDGYDDFVIECARHCRNCELCGHQVPCPACMAGGICDAMCCCDERYDDDDVYGNDEDDE